MTAITDPVTVVHALTDAVRRRDLDAGLALCHEDIVYVNHPFTMARSRSGNLRWVKAFSWVPGEVDLRIDNVGVEGDTVLTERTDILRIGGFEFHIWACGRHVVRDGRISVWYDRFDYADAAAAIPRALLWRLLGRRA